MPASCQANQRFRLPRNILQEISTSARTVLECNQITQKLIKNCIFSLRWKTDETCQLYYALSFLRHFVSAAVHPSRQLIQTDTRWTPFASRRGSNRTKFANSFDSKLDIFLPQSELLTNGNCPPKSHNCLSRSTQIDRRSWFSRIIDQPTTHRIRCKPFSTTNGDNLLLQ